MHTNTGVKLTSKWKCFAFISAPNWTIPSNVGSSLGTCGNSNSSYRLKTNKKQIKQLLQEHKFHACVPLNQGTILLLFSPILIAQKNKPLESKLTIWFWILSLHSSQYDTMCEHSWCKNRIQIYSHVHRPVLPLQNTRCFVSWTSLTDSPCETLGVRPEN